MKKLTLPLFAFIPIVLLASGLQLSKPILYMESESAYAVLNISWDNAWNNEKNKDGVWLFLKTVLPDGYQHIAVAKEGHATVSTFTDTEPSLAFRAAEDGTGIFISPNVEFRGNVSATVKIALQIESFEGIRMIGNFFLAFGLEMVQIPEGGFEVGCTSPEALDYGAFYQPNQSGEFGGPLKVDSEEQTFTVASDGDLYYLAREESYEGDQAGIIPVSFPKGVHPFLIMKYEPTEGQYIDFLNTLSKEQLADRIITGAMGYYELGGTISVENGWYKTAYPDKPCSFMSWSDAMAYADWAGLRPLTEFEFTKAARGTAIATNMDFPWGTATKAQVQRLADDNGCLLMRNGWDETDLTEDNKSYFGASFYWVMDLSGSLWERVVSIGHEKGRSFTGSHGDGFLSADGNATNADWPVGEAEAGGLGFRGGGFYGYERAYHEFNPFSPVSYRRYGGWHGVMRQKAYGARFGRGGKVE